METIVKDRVGVGKAAKGGGDSVWYLGIDIGSTSSDVVVMEATGRIIFSDYRRTNGRPIETVLVQLKDIAEQSIEPKIIVAGMTGSAGRLLAEFAGVEFVNEVSAQAEAVGFLYPSFESATVIEMGGQDSKLIFLGRQEGRVVVRDFAVNTVCAAGTGSFLDQQAARLGVNIEGQFGALALESTAVPSLAGRCSVFAKSDMIHLQQQAVAVSDIIGGLCLALARGLKGNLGGGREFARPVFFTGGVAANVGVVRAFEDVLGLGQGGMVVPEYHFFTGAIGAVLCANRHKEQKGQKETEGRIGAGELLESVQRYLAQGRSRLLEAGRLEALGMPAGRGPDGAVYGDMLEDGQEAKAYLGVDVGSISTNVVVMDDNGRVLAKEYLMTAGRPLEAVRKGIIDVAKKVGRKVSIAGAATTGSGRYLTGDFIGADVVINEITAQAAGAAIVNPGVDTIFEIGGQDSKYISLENGVVVDFEMNHACAAGTGSFLEEQAARLGVNINGEFAGLAMSSASPIKLGERCTVFMETDLLSYRQQGASIEDLLAGLSYSVAANYLNRVVGRRKIGENICFQGGTAFNKAVWSAFEKLTGRKITVPDHHEVTGALGAAWIVREHIKRLEGQRGAKEAGAAGVQSAFRGFERLANMEYRVESFNCADCANNCQLRKVLIGGAEPFYYGSRCDKYNIGRQTRKGRTVQEAFDFRNNKLMEYANLSCASGRMVSEGAKIRGRVGIPLVFFNWQYLPLFTNFFRSLGYEVVLSGRTDRKTIACGAEATGAGAGTCLPMKVALGHVARLMEKGVDYIFVPSVVSLSDDYESIKQNQLCPYVQSLPYEVRSCLMGIAGGAEILSPVLRMGEGKGLMEASFIELAKGLGISRRKAREALACGMKAQAGFDKDIKTYGQRIIESLGADEKLFVLVSRPYNGCDEGMNLRLAQKLAAMNVRAVPLDMLDTETAGGNDFDGQLYWRYGRKIVRAGEVIRDDPKLFAIYLSNFNCGPDSFIITLFRDVIRKKPSLVIELDEHSADAGLITRLEAFMESLKNYRRPLEAKEKSGGAVLSGARPTGRKLYIPYMSDCSYGLAACFRGYGLEAEVMTRADETMLLEARRHTNGKECLPCAITCGEILNTLSGRKDAGKEYMFFMPATSGPCRFGMYNCLQRLILGYAGVENATMVSPDQSDDFYRQFRASLNGQGSGSFMKDAWAATIGVELLCKTVLKIRPFAREPLEVQRVYEGILRRWLGLVESRPGIGQMRAMMEEAAGKLGKVELDYALRKPRIGIVGEIYVRNHPFANNNIIERLERLGAACELAAVSEWVYYTNFLRGRAYGRNGMLLKRMVNGVQDYFQHRIEKALAEPLEKRFGRLAEGATGHLLMLSRPYIGDTLEGEAVLTVGKIMEYHHDGAGGVVNVMPFGCMPGTIVSTQTQRISADCGGMPILNISFDGQSDEASLVMRLETFVGQVRQKNGAVSAEKVLCLS